MLQRNRLLGVLAVLAMALGGCGDDDEEAEPSASLAELAPEDTAIYIEASVRPEGDEREAIETIAARFPEGEGIGDRIEEELNESFEEGRESGDEEVTWDEDVSPWLGERVAMVFTELGSERPGEEVMPALVAEVTDTEAAEAALPEFAALNAEDVEERDSDGVHYYVDEEDVTAGLVADHMIQAPTEEDFLEMVALAEGDGKPLDEAQDFTYSVGEIDGGAAAAFAHLDTQAILRSIEVQASGVGGNNELAAVRSEEDPKPFALALEVEPDEVVLHSSAAMSAGSEREREAATELLESLPADSFAATSCPGCFEAFRAGFQAGLREGAQGEELDPGEIEDVIRERLGLDIDAFTDALGPLAVFARGENPLSLAGALVVEVKKRSEVERGLEGVRRVLSVESEVEISNLPPGLPDDPSGFSVASPGVPVGVNVAFTDERLVVAVGEEATVDAFEAEEPLAESDEFQSQIETLGEGYTPQLFADFDAIARLVGFADAEAESYVEPLRLAVAGARKEGDRSVGRLSITFDEE